MILVALITKPVDTSNGNRVAMSTTLFVLINRKYFISNIFSKKICLENYKKIRVGREFGQMGLDRRRLSSNANIEDVDYSSREGIALAWTRSTLDREAT